MRKYTRNLTLSALFLALGYVLPFLTGQIPQFGSMLLPMHIPVFLCGLICGWQYGAIVGLILPLTRSLFFIMPPFYVALAMTFELATYGFVAGFLYSRARKQGIVALYCSMIIAMLAGRLISGQCVHMAGVHGGRVRQRRTGNNSSACAYPSNHVCAGQNGLGQIQALRNTGSCG